MKKTALIIAILMLVTLFGGCKNTLAESETTTDFSANADESFKQMKDAIQQGNFSEAINQYNNGAASVDDPDITSWYFYAMAMQKNTENNCLGCTIDLLENCGDLFELKNEKYAPLKETAEKLNGAYEARGNYLYIVDGKVKISEGEQIKGEDFCASELSFDGKTYYWVDISPDGTHTVMYKITKTETGVSVVLAGENTDDKYVGEYSAFVSEYPTLYFVN